MVTHFKGRIWQWDVVNEAVSDPWDTPSTLHYRGFWAQHLRPGYIADAFRWAARAYQELKVDLIYSGPPYVLPRVPQKPRRQAPVRPLRGRSWTGCAIVRHPTRAGLTCRNFRSHGLRATGGHGRYDEL